MGVQKTTKKRTVFVLAFWLVCIAGLVGRLVQLQAIAPAREKQSNALDERDILPRRGAILSRAGVPLALTIDRFDVTANPPAVPNRAQAAVQLAALLGLPKDEILKKLSKTQRWNPRTRAWEKNHYVMLKEAVPEAVAANIRGLLTPKDRKTLPPLYGIELRERHLRYYPLRQFAAQLLGYLNDAGAGVAGLESGYDEELGGVAGKEIAKRDAKKRAIPGEWHEVIPPVDGHDIVLTIDDGIQLIAERAVEVAQRKYRPNWMCALVMRPRTGEVLAMTTKPDFDPNRVTVQDVSAGRTINYATRFAYEPGSTFKLITAAAAVERVPTWDVARYNCEGVRQVGKHSIRCWIYWLKRRGHGIGGLSDAIKDSCNLVICRFAQEMGGDSFLDYIRNFGFGKPTGVFGERKDGRGRCREARGIVPARIERKDPAHLANISFGQAVMVTPMQLLTAVCAIANEGVLMKPYLVREIRTSEGDVILRHRPQVVRRVIARSTARAVTSFMVRCVKEGTGKPGAVPGYEVAGKTGTAQKVTKGAKTYSGSAYVSSFVGFLPARRPELAILVVADEPKGSYYGSQVCAPVFREIAEKSMIRLKMIADH
ncbi:MAG: penicillin-binding transpeptidase domain-containing protein [Abditibacteriales bacterium]|nr:penicillin-binding transpeptidase domain-containing protein [Abditibacteriales bacterium]MDW8366529.1 penicillin-binding transpeptidase domain-containing protein [Abditibacteriales bacterium]